MVQRLDAREHGNFGLVTRPFLEAGAQVTGPKLREEPRGAHCYFPVSQRGRITMAYRNFNSAVLSLLAVLKMAMFRETMD